MNQFSPNEEFIRFTMLYHFIKKETAVVATKNICDVLGNILDVRKCQRWFKKFRSGNFDLKNSPGSGRPREVDPAVLTAEIESDPTASIEKIADKLGYSWSSVQKHLKKIGKTWRKGRWVPHALSEENLGERVRACEESEIKKESETPFVNDLITGDEKWVLYSNHGRKNQWLSKRQVAKPTPKPGLTTKKVLLSVWWDCKGIIHFETLKPGHAINAKVYCEQLDRLAAEIKKKRPSLVNRRQVFLQHDNARPHTARITREKIKSLGWKEVRHPPYSPDIAPSDYHLFSSMQHYLDGKNYKSYENINKGLNDYFNSKPMMFYERGIKMLPDRWRKVISNDGNYIL